MAGKTAPVKATPVKEKKEKVGGMFNTGTVIACLYTALKDGKAHTVGFLEKVAAKIDKDVNVRGRLGAINAVIRAHDGNEHVQIEGDNVKLVKGKMPAKAPAAAKAPPAKKKAAPPVAKKGKVAPPPPAKKKAAPPVKKGKKAPVEEVIEDEEEVIEEEVEEEIVTDDDE